MNINASAILQRIENLPEAFSYRIRHLLCQTFIGENCAYLIEIADFGKRSESEFIFEPFIVIKVNDKPGFRMNARPGAAEAENKLKKRHSKSSVAA
nr:hypothetical protein [Clostridia bacterium]